MYRDKDKERRAKYRWATDNPDKVRKAKSKQAHKSRDIRNKTKAYYGCMNPACPCFNDIPPYCLDFHHLEDKAFNLGSNNMAIKRTVAEINKCTVLCAVCHRLELWGELDTSAFPKCKVDENGNVINRTK